MTVALMSNMRLLRCVILPGLASLMVCLQWHSLQLMQVDTAAVGATGTGTDSATTTMTDSSPASVVQSKQKTATQQQEKNRHAMLLHKLEANKLRQSFQQPSNKNNKAIISEERRLTSSTQQQGGQNRTAFKQSPVNFAKNHLHHHVTRAKLVRPQGGRNSTSQQLAVRQSRELKRRQRRKKEDEKSLVPLERQRPNDKVIFFVHIHKSAGSLLCKVAQHSLLSVNHHHNCNVQPDQKCCGNSETKQSQTLYAQSTPYDLVAAEMPLYEGMDYDSYNYIVILRPSLDRYWSHWKHIVREAPRSALRQRGGKTVKNQKQLREMRKDATNPVAAKNDEKNHGAHMRIEEQAAAAALNLQQKQQQPNNRQRRRKPFDESQYHHMRDSLDGHAQPDWMPAGDFNAKAMARDMYKREPYYHRKQQHQEEEPQGIMDEGMITTAKEKLEQRRQDVADRRAAREEERERRRQQVRQRQQQKRRQNQRKLLQQEQELELELDQGEILSQGEQNQDPIEEEEEETDSTEEGDADQEGSEEQGQAKGSASSEEAEEGEENAEDEEEEEVQEPNTTDGKTGKDAATTTKSNTKDTSEHKKPKGPPKKMMHPAEDDATVARLSLIQSRQVKQSRQQKTAAAALGMMQRPIVGSNFSQWWNLQPDNWNLRQICGTYCVKVPKYQLSMQHWMYTLDRVSKFHTVLFQHDLQTSMDTLAQRLHWNQSNLTAVQGMEDAKNQKKLLDRRDRRMEALERRRRGKGGAAPPSSQRERMAMELIKHGGGKGMTPPHALRRHRPSREVDPVMLNKEVQWSDWNPLMSILDDALYELAQYWEQQKDKMGKGQPLSLSIEDWRDHLSTKTLQLVEVYLDDEQQSSRGNCTNACCTDTVCSAW